MTLSAEQLSGEIIKSIQERATPMTTLVIELIGFDRVGNPHIQVQLLRRLFSVFWVPLVRRLQKINKTYPGFKCILFLVANGQLRDDTLPETLICSHEQFDCHKLVELPLSHWTIEDVQYCLFHYKKMKNPDAARVADAIYHATDRTPRGIAKEITDLYLSTTLFNGPQE